MSVVSDNLDTMSGTITINGVSYSIQEFLQAMQDAYS
jgi:hypothetical protein